jgi:hypothetical protein
MMNPPMPTLSPVWTSMRVERLSGRAGVALGVDVGVGVAGGVAVAVGVGVGEGGPSGTTKIILLVPVMEALLRSVAVIVWFPV